MDFFKYDNGRIHGARIAGMIYVLALALWFPKVQLPMSIARTVFTVGWWLTFCDKRPSRLSDYGARHIAGLIFVVGGILAQFYLVHST